MASGFTNIEGEQYSPPAFSLADYLVSGQPQSYVDDLNSTLTDRLYALYKAAPESVRDDLLILSGARSNERQQQLWDAALKKYGSPEAARKWVAPPGSSQHNKGNAVDFRYASPEAQKWVHKNAGDYGLYFRMGHEPWHVEPVPNWDGKVPPIPKLDIGGRAPIPVAVSQFIEGARQAFQASVDKTPLPRPRPTTTASGTTTVAAGSPIPATMSPSIAARRRVDPATLTDTGGLLAALGAMDNEVGLSVTPRVPASLSLDSKFANPVGNARTNYAPTWVPMTQSGVQARATILDEGAGSLLNSRSPSLSAPNPVPVRPTSANANRSDLANDMAILRQLTGAAPKVAPKSVATAPATTATNVVTRPSATIGASPAAKPTAGNTLVASRPDTPIGSLPTTSPSTSAPGAGLTPAQRAAMISVNGTAAAPPPSIVNTGQGIAGTAVLPANYKPPASVMPTTAPKPGNMLTSITNPAYTAWVQKYGDGSQVQTAATGGMVTKNQLAAIQGVGGAVQKPIVAPPPAPPKMITVAKPANTLTAPVPISRPAQPANTIVAIGGYLYDSSQKTANGGLLKVGKVDPRSGASSSGGGGGGGNTLSTAPRSSSSSSSSGVGLTGNPAFAEWARG